MITGTGSSAFASVDNVHTIMGGHGFPLGDKASGAWLHTGVTICPIISSAF